MVTSLPNGASISARTRTPSLNLSRLCEFLLPALNPGATGPFIRYADGRLDVDLIRPLLQLVKSDEFKKDFAPGENSGFLQDVEPPPKYMSAKLGGRLVPGSEGKTTRAVDKLRAAVSAILDSALPASEEARLVVPSVQAELDSLADNLGVNLRTAPANANLVPIGFATADRKAEEREQDVARVLSAVELVEGQDWLDRLMAGIRTKLRNDDLDEDEIDPILDSIRAQREQPGSQIRRFLDFLDDEALARVRLQVTFKLMSAIAGQSTSPGLKAFVANVLMAFEHFADASGQALPIDASKQYGLRSAFDLSDYLRMATFYSSLPVWAEWSVQLFESRINPEHGFATKREVSYRFRVNGLNPETQKSAFATRLDRIEDKLVTNAREAQNVCRPLAELVFLRLVLPNLADSPVPEAVDQLAMRIATDLKANPGATVARLIGELRQRELVMEALSKELIHVLKTKSKRLVTDANRVADKFYVAVHRSVVNWTALRAMASKNTEVLVKNETGHDQITWFQHLSITTNPADAPAIASYLVESHLMERSLAPTGPAKKLGLVRDLTGPVLAVRMLPCRVQKDSQQLVALDAMTEGFDAGCGVDIRYALELLQQKPTNDAAMKLSREQYRTASCAAFAILAYVTLWELGRRLRKVAGMDALTMHLLRLQPGGREVDSTDATAAVYAACQAIERALSRELTVKMQGFNLRGDAGTIRFRKTNSLYALQGSMPLKMPMEGSLDKVAVLSYVTRPCDMHPLYEDADGYLYMSRTICADRDGQQMVMRVEHMQSRLVESRKSFREPELILEEIARLKALGYQHIVLLSHHYGNRHIGRAAERHAPHGTHEFLEAASAKFPDVYLYPLRRDVFPATRLRVRGTEESGFEVVTFIDHQRMYEQTERELLRGFHPIYTFATLAVVVDAGRPQSGFCTYYFDIEQRLSNLNWSETVRQNILGMSPPFSDVRASILAVLRGIHYLESERPASKNQILPVLDPYGWAMPTGTNAAGELAVVRRHNKGSVLLSFPAMLAQVTKILHKSREPA